MVEVVEQKIHVSLVISLQMLSDFFVVLNIDFAAVLPSRDSRLCRVVLGLVRFATWSVVVVRRRGGTIKSLQILVHELTIVSH